MAHQGDFAAARSLLKDSLAAARALDDWPRAFGMERLAIVVTAQGECIWAARLLGAAEALRENCGVPVTPMERVDYEPAMVAARADLGERTFTSAWTEGRNMTFEQVLAAPGRAAAISPEVEQSAIITGKPAPTYPTGLTSREVEVLRLVAQGLTDAQVAEQLVISPRTVNTHLTSIYNKLGVDSRTAAARFAVEHRIL